MNKKFKLGVIGGGFMATAIINGAIDSGVLNKEQLIVSDISQLSLEKFMQNGIETTTDNLFLASNSEFVLFAVKPQSIKEVLTTIEACDCGKFVSIMAGVKKQRIKDVFPSANVARCMPNTPCSISSGAIGLDVTDFENENDRDFITKLLSALATVVLVDESKLNAVTGVSGSSPAYFYLFLKGIIDSGVKQGLSEEEAKTLAVSTMVGAGKMVLSNQDKTLDDLINAVCSKGGTTIEAINVFKSNNLDKITEKAIDACVKRAIELENL